MSFQDCLQRIKLLCKEPTQEELTRAREAYRAKRRAEQQHFNAVHSSVALKTDGPEIERFKREIENTNRESDVARIIGAALCKRFDLVSCAAFDKEPLRVIRAYGLTNAVNATISVLRGGPDKFDEPLGMLGIMAKRLNEMGK